MNRRRTLSIVFIACASFLAALLVALLVWDWSWFRGHAERAASDAIGRNVTIGGLISVDLGLTTRVVLNDVTMANSSWGKADSFAHVERLDVSVSVPALIRGETEIRSLALSGFTVALERNANGDANWIFKGGNPNRGNEDGAQITIRRITMRDGSLRFSDQQASRSFDLKIATMHGTIAEESGEVVVDGTGSFQGMPFDLALNTGSIDALRRRSRPFPVDLSARVGENRFSASGSIQAPPRLDSMDFRINLEGPDLSKLANLAGMDVPATPAFALRGRVVQKGDTLTFENLSARLGENALTVSGRVRSLAEAEAMDLHVDAKGSNLAVLAGLAGLSMPETAPYEFKGRVVYGDNEWTLDDFSARLGRSDLAGNIRVNIIAAGKGGALPRVTGELRSNALDLDDFDELFGVEARDEGDGQKRPNNATTKDRVIPDVPLPVEWLKAIEGDVRVTVRSIENVYGDIDSVAGHVVLEEGKLTIDQLDLTAGDGKLAASATVDARGDSVAVSLNGEIRKLDLATVLPKGAVERINGQLGGSVTLSGGGQSLLPLLKSLHGEVTAFLAGGELNRLLAEAAGLDVLGTLRSLVGDKAATTRIRCMVADFDVDGGVLDSNALVLDTDSLLLTGDGRISLPDEAVNITLTPRARGINPLSFSAPLIVSGSFRDVRIAPQVTGLGAQAGKTFALGLLLGPMAALAPVIEEKLVGDSNCAALLKDARTPSDGEKDERNEVPSKPSPREPFGIPQER